MEQEPFFYMRCAACQGQYYEEFMVFTLYPDDLPCGKQSRATQTGPEMPPRPDSSTQTVEISDEIIVIESTSEDEDEASDGDLSDGDTMEQCYRIFLNEQVKQMR